MMPSTVPTSTARSVISGRRVLAGMYGRWARGVVFMSCLQPWLAAAYPSTRAISQCPVAAAP